METKFIMKYDSIFDTSGYRVDLRSTLDAIKSPLEVENFNSLREAYVVDKNSYDELKKQLPSFAFAGTFKERKINGIENYIGLVVLDIDKISSIEKLNLLKGLISNEEFTAFCFVSPSGFGLKIGVFMDCVPELHEDGFNQVKSYYSNILKGTPIDESTKDVSRLCFASYDPDIYINEEYKTFNVADTKMSKMSKCQNATGHIATGRQLGYVINHVDSILEYKIGKRNNYLSQAAYIANRHGINKQAVIDYFVNLNDLPKDEIFKTVNSAYKMTGENGILKYDFAYNFAYTGNEDIHIPKQVYDALPKCLSNPLQYESDIERDMALLSLLTLSSSLFYMVKGDYRGETIHPNLMAMIIAPPASGKGVVTIAPKMAASCMNFFNKTKPVSDLKRFQLSGNSSSAMLYPRLAANDGVGFMFEQEGDAISNNFKSEWGDITVHLRKSFHNEELTYERKIEKEMIAIPSPRFGFLATMTPNQLAGLIKNRENGLFSRMLYYVNTQPAEFGVLDPALYNKYNIDKAVQESGSELYNWFIRNHDKEKRLIITTDQFKNLQEQWTVRYKQWQKMYGVHNGDIVFRLAVSSFKLLMVLSVWRYIENQDDSLEIHCLDKDIDTSVELMSVLFYHGMRAAKIYSKSKSDTSLHSKVLTQLDTTFKTGQYVAKYVELGGKDRTAKRHLNSAVDKSIKKIGHGVYEKLAA